jgi:UDP-glucose 4-epimerase
MASTTKRAVVTGSGGFIGKVLVSSLKQSGFSVIEIDLEHGIDITESQSLDEVFNEFKTGDIDIAVHLAARMFVPLSWKNPVDTYRVNVMGTLNLIEQCRKLDINKFIFASSYIYGQPEYLPIDEKHPVKPGNPYAHSKYIAEKMCRAYQKDFGLKCIILRPFNIYGPGQNPDFLIPTIINQLNSDKIELMDPVPKRDYLFISDMISAYHKAIDYEGSDFELFNIGYGESYSVSEISDLVLELSGSSIPVVFSGEKRQSEISDTVADISHAKQELNWSPEVSIKEGIKATIHGV